MEDVDFSDEFCAFVQTAIPAVQAAELLLLLREQPAQWWQPGEVVASLRTGGLTDVDGARYLELFQARGLLAIGPDRRVQYRPANPHIAGHVDKLAQAYSERPVTLIRMIYALRDMRIRSFAEAFNMTKGNR